ncbi:hypothetical protein HMPREF1869_00607 [Bacteroidales bacterium KA00251]|nr:hypothetical protein HMPREF1869_00607 [Bacteroidales bacterium KA00251]
MKKLLFDRRNYTVLALALVLIILGFALMSGGKSSDGVSFNPAIFSPRRIVVAPIISLVGFLLAAIGVLLPKKKSNEEKEDK